MEDSHQRDESPRGGGWYGTDPVVLVLSASTVLLASYFLFLFLKFRIPKKTAVALEIARMDQDERREYYLYLFRENGGEFELTEDQVVLGKRREEAETEAETEQDTKDSDTEENDSDDASSCSVYLSLCLEQPGSGGASQGRKARAGENIEAGLATTKRAEVQKQTQTQTQAPKQTQPLLVRGQCVVCFEPFLPGERVVRSVPGREASASASASGGRGCPHVFHKDCLVGCLVHRPKPASGGEPLPACPTCRRGFCDLLPPPRERRCFPVR